MDILAYYINTQSLISIYAHTNIYKHTQTILGEEGVFLVFHLYQTANSSSERVLFTLLLTALA